MQVPNVEELKRVVKNWIAAHSPAALNGSVVVHDHTDFIAQGLLDSFGLADLLLHVEEFVGCSIDLSDLDLNEFTTVDGFCNSVASICGLAGESRAAGAGLSV